VKRGGRRRRRQRPCDLQPTISKKQKALEPRIERRSVRDGRLNWNIKSQSASCYHSAAGKVKSVVEEREGEKQERKRRKRIHTLLNAVLMKALFVIAVLLLVLVDSLDTLFEMVFGWGTLLRVCAFC
jgi:hypothetical protein